MRLRREITCAAALRQAIDVGNYRAALQHATELCTIDPAWSETRLALEDIVTADPERPRPEPTPAQSASSGVRSVGHVEGPRIATVSVPPRVSPLDRDRRRRPFLRALALAALALCLAAALGWTLGVVVPRALFARRTPAASPEQDANASASSAAPTLPPEVPNLPPIGDQPVASLGSDAIADVNGGSQNRQPHDSPVVPEVSRQAAKDANPAGSRAAPGPPSADNAPLRTSSADFGRSAIRSSDHPEESRSLPSGSEPRRSLSPSGTSGDAVFGSASGSVSPSSASAQKSQVQEPANPPTGLRGSSQSLAESGSPATNVPSRDPAQMKPPVPPDAAANFKPGMPASGETPPESMAPSSPATAPPRSSVQPPAPVASLAVARDEVDRRAIASMLGAYERAYSALDARGVRRVWPSVDGEALDKAFSQLESQRLTFSGCTVAINDMHAAATCRGVATYVPRVGSGDRVTVQRTWQFALRRFGEGWLIDSAAIR